MRRSLLLFISLLMLSAALGMGTGLWQKYQKGRETYEQAEQIYIRRKTEISEMPQDKEEKTEKKTENDDSTHHGRFYGFKKTESGCDRVAVHPIHRIELSGDAGRG